MNCFFNGDYYYYIHGHGTRDRNGVHAYHMKYFGVGDDPAASNINNGLYGIPSILNVKPNVG